MIYIISPRMNLMSIKLGFMILNKVYTSVQYNIPNEARCCHAKERCETRCKKESSAQVE